MKFDSKLFWNVALWIFVITILSQAISLIYQQTFLSAFNIDHSVLSLSVDAGYALRSAFMMLLISLGLLIMYFYIKALFNIPSLIRKFTHAFNVFTDLSSFILLLVCLGAIIFYHEPSSLVVSPLLLKGLVWFLVLSIIFIFLIKITYIFKNVRKHNKSIRESYDEIGLRLLVSPRTNVYAKLSSIPMWIPITVIAAIFVIVVPTSLANEDADKKTVFTVVTESETKQGIKLLVISRSSEGLIAKYYNTNINKFEQGFKVLSNNNLKFDTYTINNTL